VKGKEQCLARGEKRGGHVLSTLCCFSPVPHNSNPLQKLPAAVSVKCSLVGGSASLVFDNFPVSQ
jgi:hypothetical protein